MNSTTDNRSSQECRTRRERDEARAEYRRLQETYDIVAAQREQLYEESARLRAALHAHHTMTAEEVLCRECKRVRGF